MQYHAMARGRRAVCDCSETPLSGFGSMQQRQRSKTCTQTPSTKGTLLDQEEKLAVLLAQPYLNQPTWGAMRTAIEELKQLMFNWRTLRLEADNNRPPQEPGDVGVVATAI